MNDHHHATCLVIGERGILIRGASGAGKSQLARDLICHFQAGGFARLVADDRVAIVAAAGRLIASPHAGIAGRIEHRGLGVVAAPHEPACVLALVIDLSVPPDRMPDPASLVTTIAGISLPRLAAETPRDGFALALAWLAGGRAE